MDKNILRYKGSKRVMGLIGLMTILQAVTIIFQAKYLAQAITALFQGTAVSAVLPLFSLFLAAFILRQILQWAKERIAYRFAEVTALEFQKQLIKKIFELGPKSIGKYGSGQIITLALEGTSQFKTYLQLFIPRLLGMSFIPVILFFYVFTLDRTSGIILAVVLPILVIFLILLGLAAQKQIDAQLENYQLLARHFVDSLRGLVTLKYLGKSKAHKKAIEHVSNKYRIATNRTLRVAFLSTFSLDFFSSLSVALIAVELGLRLINGNIGLEPALMILILAPEYFSPIRELGNDYHATMDGKEAGENIREVLAEEVKTSDQTTQTISPWDEKSSLTFKNIQRSTDERTILHDINFTVSGYQKVGIVGTSGAGKSSLIDLLSGFAQPQNGKIEVNNEKLTDLTIRDWQKQLSYIPQHPYVFSGTVAENISFYEENIHREQIEEAAQVAGLTELIQSFEHGLDEKIGQAGRELSGGEEQRIAIARTMLQDASILLLDEPTAHLDIETEHEIKQLLLPLMEERLVFLATHRLHWMKEMDIIFVMDNGQITEIGSHEQLLEKNGRYSKLVAAHKSGVST